MPGEDRVIDPITGDYVVNDDESEYETTTTIKTMVYHQVNTPFDSWPGDPDAGRKQTVENTSAQELSDLRQSYLAAMQALVDEGLATDPTVKVSTDPNVPSRVVVKGTIVDRQSGAIDVSKLTRFKE